MIGRRLQVFRGIRWPISACKGQIDKPIDGTSNQQQGDAEGEKGGNQHSWHVALLQFDFFYLSIMLIQLLWALFFRQKRS